MSIVSYAKKEHIAVVEAEAFSAEETVQVLKELKQAMECIEQDQDVYVLVLTGEGIGHLAAYADQDAAR